jgi:hypothetical protein
MLKNTHKLVLKRSPEGRRRGLGLQLRDVGQEGALVLMLSTVTSIPADTVVRVQPLHRSRKLGVSGAGGREYGQRSVGVLLLNDAAPVKG